MKLALCQLAILWEKKEQSFGKCIEFIRKAAKQGVELILFPEMSLTGFSMNIEKTMERQEETIGLFSQQARLEKIAIGFGYVKEIGDKAENHYVVLDDTGKIIADYIKIHPFTYGGENQYFVAGEKLSLFQYKNFTIGLSICYDLRFPELYQIMSKKAELILVPANWPETRREHWNCLLQARAIENQVYIVGINCVGDIGNQKYSGDSRVIDPLGVVCGQCEEKEELLTVEIDNDVQQCRECFPVKKDRRELLYQTLGE